MSRRKRRPGAATEPDVSRPGKARSGEPRPSEPRHSAPRSSEPRPTGPRSSRPRPSVPRSSELRSTEPRSSEPRPSRRLAIDISILVAVFAATVGIAELAGAANLGVAIGVGQVTFALVLVALLLRG
jgi:hypothetical protein